MFPHSPDVAVIGAGPVGCVAALAFARKGARVLLLDGNPRSAQRLAGECLHPPGVEVLNNLGLQDFVKRCCPGRGFIVFPSPLATHHAPLVLNYPEQSNGLTCEHAEMVCSLRQAASSHPNVQLLYDTQATGIEDQRLCFAIKGGRVESVRAELIVGADGRSSLARKCLGLPDQRVNLSSMAGVLLEGVEPVKDGFGHVFLGGPGPVLACRIGPGRIRLFLDVPPGRTSKSPEYLWNVFHSILPVSWNEPFGKALAEEKVIWASNQFRPRIHFGRPGLALVGDAVGHYHPLTAVGLTMGFLDAACLARSRDFADYRRQRSLQSEAPELLAYSLYKVFTLGDPGTSALQNAVFHLWRNCPAESRRTMRLLTGDETDSGQFNRAFLRVLLGAVQGVWKDSFLAGRWRHSFQAMTGIAQWVRWLTRGGTEAGIPRTLPINSEKSTRAAG